MIKLHKKPKRSKLRYLLLLSIVGVILAQLFFSCSLSTYGGEINHLLEEKRKLEEENQVLENQVAKLSSLSFIRERAELELRMVPAEIEFFSARRPAQLARLGSGRFSDDR